MSLKRHSQAIARSSTEGTLRAIAERTQSRPNAQHAQCQSNDFPANDAGRTYPLTVAISGVFSLPHKALRGDRSVWGVEALLLLGRLLGLTRR